MGIKHGHEFLENSPGFEKNMTFEYVHEFLKIRNECKIEKEKKSKQEPCKKRSRKIDKRKK